MSAVLQRDDADDAELRAEYTRLAVESFHRQALAGLESAGVKPSITAVAVALGIERTLYSNVLNGHRGSIETVCVWIHRWAAAGYRPIELRLWAGGVDGV